MLSYQVVDRGIAAASRPYKNLPRVSFNYAPLSGNKKINLKLTSEFTYFDRTDETEVTVDVTGFRADIYPSISYPMRSQSAFLIPKVGVHHTQYSLAQQGPFKESPSRTIPIVSLDSGLFLERGTAFGVEISCIRWNPGCITFMYPIKIRPTCRYLIPLFSTWITTSCSGRTGSPTRPGG